MSLNSIIAQGVEQAFAAAQDVVSSGTYYSRSGAGVYNSAADTYVSPTTTYSNVRMVRAGLTEQEREASPVSVSDVKVLIPAVDLGNHKPKESDTFYLDGVTYNVLSFKGVPGDSLWIIFAREK